MTSLRIRDRFPRGYFTKFYFNLLGILKGVSMRDWFEGSFQVEGVGAIVSHHQIINQYTL